MCKGQLKIWFLGVIAWLSTGNALAQDCVNDTIRLGVIIEKGQTYPMIFLPEVEITKQFMDAAQRLKWQRLRSDIYTVYPYALTAATIFRDVTENADKIDGRRDRKKYLKAIDRKLDKVFK